MGYTNKYKIKYKNDIQILKKMMFMTHQTPHNQTQHLKFSQNQTLNPQTYILK